LGSLDLNPSTLWAKDLKPALIGTIITRNPKFMLMFFVNMELELLASTTVEANF